MAVTGAIDRRRALGLGAAGLGAAAIGGAGPFGAMAQAQSLTEGRPFSADAVLDLARVLAARPFAAPVAALPAPFNNLGYDAYVALRARPEAAVWSGEGRGFVVEPLHRGFLFAAPVGLYLVEDGEVRRVAYGPGRFDYGGLAVPPAVGDIGFSGFRLLSDEPEGEREVAIFQGATFFRSLARGQNLGVTARALALRTSDPRGEEFPQFRAFWIERPTPGAGTVTIHALVDSESCAGVFRFALRPGDVTIVDVEATLVPRAPVDRVGLGAMQSMVLQPAGERRPGADDLRPAVQESSGLQIHNGRGEWAWRPLRNPDALQVSGFVDTNPRGFGLLQRDRDFNAFLDDDQRFEQRASLWVEPIGDWGEGAVELVEIPTASERNDNVVAYWRPRAPLLPGTETTLAYRQFWCWAPPGRPSLLACVATRVGRGSEARRRRFAVAFAGPPGGEGVAALGDVRAALSAAPGGAPPVRLAPSPDGRLLRALFEIDPGGAPAVELRLVLETGGRPVSETWLYRWTP